MGPKTKSTYRCGECGHAHSKWVGRCEGCGVWNAVAEELVREPVPLHKSGPNDLAVPVPLSDVSGPQMDRWATGLPELDYVLGGGLVPGSVTLIGGEPGIGKSTILLQVAARLSGMGHTVLYASGEESPGQIRLRGDRLIEDAGSVRVVGESRIEDIIAAAIRSDAQLLIVDSIQTASLNQLDSAPGSVAQVREGAARLMRFAKETGTAVMVVGHVTKGGGIAGPKTLEHIVDTVLYFEGERTLDYRLLRVTKSRFGSVDELGVFRMTAHGLEPVPNPSEIFLSARSTSVSGSAVTALMEGTRPVLVEVQALTTAAGFGTPQRVAAGLNPKRLAVLLAVLERRAGCDFSKLDVFVQVSAGVRLDDPTGDLAVAAALVSSVTNRPTPADGIFLGEIGLGGDVRPMSGSERRLVEAARMGFRRVFAGGIARMPDTLVLVELSHVQMLVPILAA